MSETRLEAIVRDGLARGKNADQIARTTGVANERVQRVMHRLNGRDPAKASRETRKTRRQMLQQVYGTAAGDGLQGPALPRSRGGHRHGR
jgi:hypothetical protein